MFKTLVDDTASAAQAVLNTPNLPPSAQNLRAHAAAFRTDIVPKVDDMTGRVRGFAQAAVATTSALPPLLDDWRAGQDQARIEILSHIATLFDGLSGAVDADRAAYAALSGYRDSVLDDQRAVADILRDLSSQMAALQDQIRDGREQLASQQRRLAVLRAIPFPLPWAIEEIVSLISSGKTLEQRLSELEDQQRTLQGQAGPLNDATNTVGGFAGRLSRLENAAQNLVNFVSVAQGNLLQTQHTLEGGQGSASPIVVEAYVDTLRAQAQQIQTFLDQG